MKLQGIFFSLLFILILCTKGISQCEPLILPTAYCETAPTICFNQACFTTSNEPVNCCNNWCGNNTIINNPQFFQFTPSQPDITIAIHVDDCNNGSGLQAGIIDACPWDNSNILDCNPGVNPGGSMILTANGLITGQPYWFFIDGSNGSICHYTVTTATGIQPVLLNDSLDLDETYANDTLVCTGYKDLVFNTGPLIQGAYYKWIFGWNGQEYVSDFPTISIDIEEDAPSGTWDVCVMAYTGCDSTNQACFPITIETTPPVVKGPATFCNEEFPFLWNGLVINGPGNYTATITDEHNCSFDSIWTVSAFPLYAPGIIDTFVCSAQFQLGEFTFDQSGHYTLLLPNATSNGCDSILELDLILGAPDQFIELVCENDQPSLQVHIIAQDASIDTVTFQWYDCTFDSLLSTATTFLPNSAGCYGLITQSGVCSDTISSEYLVSPCEINIQCGLASNFACVGDPFLLTPAFPVPEDARVHWLLNPPGEESTYIGSGDSIYVTFQSANDLLGVSYTVQAANQTWSCHENLVVNTGPDVGICCDVSTCDTCAIYSLINSSADPAFIFLNDGTIPPITPPGVTTQMVCFPSMPLDSLLIGIVDVVSATNGCTGSIVGDTFITITQVPEPLVFIVDFRDSLCSYPNDLASYRWRQCDSTTVLSTSTCFVPPSSGCYCLEVENEIGCTFETCTDFIVNTSSLTHDDQVKITPNPSNGNITIELPFHPLPVEWQLNDMQGKMVSNGSLITSKSDLRLNFVSAGIYFLKLDVGKNGILVKKIVIQ